LIATFEGIGQIGFDSSNGNGVINLPVTFFLPEQPPIVEEGKILYS
jgi:hypothetical protein